MSAVATLDGLYRVCVKLYSPEPWPGERDAEAFVPIFHEWIQRRSLDLVLIDVADYAHAPESPGIMLVTHEVGFALDRSDGRFGLLAQRRVPLDGTAADAVESTLLSALKVAGMLERDPRLAGKLRFDPSRPRIEANDRLRAPNSAEGYEAFEPAVREAVRRVYGGEGGRIERVENDPRDRLSVTVAVDGDAAPPAAG